VAPLSLRDRIERAITDSARNAGTGSRPDLGNHRKVTI